MAIEKMLLVNLLGKMEYLDTAVEQCCIDDDFHPERALTILDDTDGYTAITEENPYTPLLQTLVELPNVHAPPLTVVDYKSLTITKETLRDYIQTITGKFESLHEDRKILLDQINDDEISISQLTHFTELNVRLDEVFSCQFTKVRFGRIPKDSYPKLSAYESNPYMLFFPGSADLTHYWGVYFCPTEQSSEIDRIFSHLYFERLRIPEIHGTPAEGILLLKKSLSEKRELLHKLDYQIKALWEIEQEQYLMVYSFLTHLNDVFDMRRYAAYHGSLFHLVGYIPASKSKDFEARFYPIDEIEFVLESPDEYDALPPPIRLKNNWFSKPFQMFIDMYGLPKYSEIDPTFFVSIGYTLLFGIMFGDIGQGIMVILAGIFMHRKMKMKLGPILTRCGVVSVFFGIIYGSAFGIEEPIHHFYKATLGIQPFEVMKSESIILILGLAIGLGVVINLISMLLHIYSAFKQKNIGNALFSQSGLAGLLFYGSLIGAVAGMLLGSNVVTTPYFLLLILLPLILIFLREPLGKLVAGKSNWQPESWKEYAIENFFELFEFLLSYFTNTMSYLRVGAFVLVHAGMMKVVFVIAGLFGPMGYVISAIIGNIIVASLEALLVGIQCLRLEYYEMFSRFYEGSGRPFQSIHQSKPLK